MSKSFLAEATVWEQPPFDNETRQAVSKLKNNPTEEPDDVIV